MALTLRLLGAFELEGDGRRLELSSRKAQALLAYLALAGGRSQSREVLADLFWPKTAPAQARQSLRQALLNIRHALPGAERHRVRAATDSVAFDISDVRVDVIELTALADDTTSSATERAAALCRGDFLAGIPVSTIGFDRWAVDQRLQFTQLALAVLGRLLRQQAARGEPNAAIQTARRRLELDPADEPTHQILIRLYADLGLHAAARRQYHACASAVRREHRRAPRPETQELYRRLLAERAQTAGPLFGVSTGRAPAPEPILVGRETERSLLVSALETLHPAAGRIFAITGEAGIGKTHLARSLIAAARQRTELVLLGGCYETQQGFPFAVWIDGLRSRPLADYGEAIADLPPVWKAELGRLLPELRSGASSADAQTDDPLGLFLAVGRLLEQLAARGPLLVVLEDVHWADEMSLKLLAHVVRSVTTSPIRIVLTAREAEVAATSTLHRLLHEMSRPPLVVLPLQPLTPTATAELVRALLPRAVSEADLGALSDRIVRLSEGNPFIVVEAMRELREGLNRDTLPAAVPLPQRVRELIASRLARLPKPLAHVLEVAAVFGRRFEFALLHAACGRHEDETAESVEGLVRLRHLEMVGEDIDFAHDYIRMVVHEAMSFPKRRLLHRAVAQALEAMYGDDPEHYPALARHYELAGSMSEAARYFENAGRTALQQFAYDAAGQFLRQAFEAFRRLPIRHRTTESNLDVRLALAYALIRSGNFDEAVEHLRHAELDAGHIHDTGRLGQVLSQLAMHAALTGDAMKAIEYGDRALRILPDASPIAFPPETNVQLVIAYCSLGRYRDAVDRCRSIAGIEVPSNDRPSLAIISSGLTIWALAELGDFQEARAIERDMMAQVPAIASDDAMVSAYCSAAYLALVTRDGPRALRLLESVRHLCDDQRNALVVPAVFSLLGYAHAVAGEPAMGIRFLLQASEMASKLGLALNRARCLVWLGEAYLRAGLDADSVGAAETALELSRRHGERGNEGYALRLRAEVLFRAGTAPVGEVIGLYQQAVQLAGELGMRPLLARCYVELSPIADTRDDVEASGRFARLARELSHEMRLDGPSAAGTSAHSPAP